MAALSAGTLTIEIATNVARIKADMDEAKKVIGGAMKDVEQYVGFAKTALVGLIGFGSISAFRGLIESGIEAKAKLYDLSLQTGISVEALSALGKVAKYSNTSLDDVTSASNKLSKAMFTQNEDSKGAAQAIKALGLNFNEFKGLGADEQMLKVAKAMAGFEDGTGKSATAMLLFGKTGAQLLPFLRELAEKTELVGKQTTESAKRAKEYEGNLITLKTASEQWRRELVDFLLPALVGVTNELIDGKKAYGSYAAAFMDVLSGSTAADGLAKTRDAIGKLNDQISALQAKADKPSLLDRLYPTGTQLQGLKDELDLLQKRKAFQETQQARLALAAGGGVLDKFDRPKPKLDPSPPPSGKDPKDDYSPLIKLINEKVALNKAEYESDIKLTDVQQLRVKINQDIATGLLTLSPVQKAAIAQDLAGAEAWEKLNLQKQADLKWFKEATDANAAYVESQMQLRDQLVDQRKEAELQLKQYGLTVEELQALSSARLRDAAAALQRKAALADDVDLSGQLSKLYRDQAAALLDNARARDTLAAKESRDRDDPMSGADRAVKEYLQDVKRAGDATYGAVANSLKGLEDLTVTALSGGDAKSAAKAWVTGIITEIERLYFVKPLLASIFGNGSGGSSGGLIGSLGSLIVNYFGGGYSANGGVGYSSGAGISGGRAGGGDVSAGKNYLIGEKGPEILRMGNQGGTVVPNNAIGTGARPVAVNIVNNGEPVQARSSQRETSQGTVIDIMLDAVANDMANGGRVHDATQRRFGLNPGASTPRR